MRNRIVTLVLVGLLVATSLMAGGQSDATGSEGGKKTIYLYQMKIEIDEGLRKVAELYQQSHPNIEFVIESYSDGYATGLRTKFAGGQAPDLFTVLGGQDMELWKPHLEDLSDQRWVDDMIDLAKEGISDDKGGIYGMPVSIEGYGYVYNKRLFEKAGITATPTTLSELKAAVTKLRDAGIQPITGAYMDWYQAGMFLVNMGFARQPDPMAFIEGLNNGTEKFVDNEIFRDVAEFILYDYGQCASPTNTGFNQQTGQLINEEVAMTLGGNWLQPSIDSTNPDMQEGLMPMPINEDAESNDKLYMGVTGYWGLNKNSKVKAEAKEFLDWLTMTDEGRKAMTDELLFIPAFSSFGANPDKVGALSNDLSNYASQSKVYGIYNSLYPAGAAEYFGNAVQMLGAGKVDVDGFLMELQRRWDQLK